MLDSESKARCPDHPDLDLVKTPACYSYQCPKCATKVCLVCGSTEHTTWASAWCEDCCRRMDRERREAERAREEAKDEWRQRYRHAVVELSDATRALLAAISAWDPQGTLVSQASARAEQAADSLDRISQETDKFGNRYLYDCL